MENKKEKLASTDPVTPIFNQWIQGLPFHSRKHKIRMVSLQVATQSKQLIQRKERS